MVSRVLGALRGPRAKKARPVSRGCLECWARQVWKVQKACLVHRDFQGQRAKQEYRE